jgi:hypothetical protein
MVLQAQTCEPETSAAFPGADGWWVNHVATFTELLDVETLTRLIDSRMLTGVSFVSLFRVIRVGRRPRSQHGR